MSLPKLYYGHLSPPATAVATVAKLLNVDLELITLDMLAGDHLKPDFVKLNPQHTIPLLIDTDGSIIVDSHAICAYLVEKYAKTDALYPKQLVQRAQVDARLHFDTGFLFARLRFLVESIFYFGYKALDADKVEYVQRAWPLLEGFLAEANYLCGDQLTIADICCGATICAVDRLAPIDAAKYPKLTAWRKRLTDELPAFVKESVEGGALLQDEVLEAVSQK